MHHFHRFHIQKPLTYGPESVWLLCSVHYWNLHSSIMHRVQVSHTISQYMMYWCILYFVVNGRILYMFRPLGIIYRCWTNLMFYEFLLFRFTVLRSIIRSIWFNRFPQTNLFVWNSNSIYFVAPKLAHIFIESSLNLARASFCVIVVYFYSI